MNIRPFNIRDRSACGELFYHTVHAICSKDYSKKQLDIWAPEVSRSGNFPRPLENNHAYVVEIDYELVGFADITKDGYLDRFFVHKDYQGLGVGKLLLKKIEEQAHSLGLQKITLEASITARPFFEKMGYHVTEKQLKHVQDVVFENFKMSKALI
jgi:putative acetyltransferase